MGVLVELASRPGEVVARQRLLERVWGAEMATDDVLSRAISELRRALGDDSRNPRFVVTVRC
jgi:DNA-binding winged helix-turn-helix (wHTH) protein